MNTQPNPDNPFGDENENLFTNTPVIDPVFKTTPGMKTTIPPNDPVGICQQGYREYQAKKLNGTLVHHENRQTKKSVDFYIDGLDPETFVGERKAAIISTYQEMTRDYSTDAENKYPGLYVNEKYIIGETKRRTTFAAMNGLTQKVNHSHYNRMIIDDDGLTHYQDSEGNTLPGTLYLIREKEKTQAHNEAQAVKEDSL